MVPIIDLQLIFHASKCLLTLAFYHWHFGSCFFDIISFTFPGNCFSTILTLLGCYFDSRRVQVTT